MRPSRSLGQHQSGRRRLTHPEPRTGKRGRHAKRCPEERGSVGVVQRIVSSCMFEGGRCVRPRSRRPDRGSRADAEAVGAIAEERCDQVSVAPCDEQVERSVAVEIAERERERLGPDGVAVRLEQSAAAVTAEDVHPIGRGNELGQVQVPVAVEVRDGLRPGQGAVGEARQHDGDAREVQGARPCGLVTRLGMGPGSPGSTEDRRPWPPRRRVPSRGEGAGRGVRGSTRLSTPRRCVENRAGAPPRSPQSGKARGVVRASDPWAWRSRAGTDASPAARRAIWRAAGEVGGLVL